MCGAPECLPEATGRPVCTKYHVSTDLSVEKGRRVHSRDHDFRAARLPVVMFHYCWSLSRPLVLVQHARDAALERGVEGNLVVTAFPPTVVDHLEQKSEGPQVDISTVDV